MVSHYLDELVESSSRVLLLQGPIGSFFLDFAKWLNSQQKTVYKLNFNAGDREFYPSDYPNTIDYVGELSSFQQFLRTLILGRQIDALVCFGDNRKYHRIAKKVAGELGVSFWAFEEGYFRPDYITLEKSGVNAFSPIPKNAEFFLEQQGKLAEPVKPERLAKGFCPIAMQALKYYICAYYQRHQYPNYQHHRILNTLYYVKLWSVSLVKRALYYIHDRSFAKRVARGDFGEFFIVPLQVYDDSQVVVHSDYDHVRDFLREVLISFANHAPPHTNLIVKHHPMDRGFIDYGEVIDEVTRDYPQLNGRIFYIHDVQMPVFLRYGKGMVTLNSTSGISGLLHGMPVKTLGRANYDFSGLTCQSSLDQFWTTPIPPNKSLFSLYRLYHLNKTQINGSFYNRVVLKYPYNAK